MRRVSLASLLAAVSLFAAVFAIHRSLRVRTPAVTVVTDLVDLGEYHLEALPFLAERDGLERSHFWTHALVIDDRVGVYAIEVSLNGAAWLHWLEISSPHRPTSVTMFETSLRSPEDQSSSVRELHLVQDDNVLSISGQYDGTSGNPSTRIDLGVGQYAIVYDQPMLDASLASPQTLPRSTARVSKQVNRTGTIPPPAQTVRIRAVRIH